MIEKIGVEMKEVAKLGVVMSGKKNESGDID